MMRQVQWSTNKMHVYTGRDHWDGLGLTTQNTGNGYAATRSPEDHRRARNLVHGKLNFRQVCPRWVPKTFNAKSRCVFPRRRFQVTPSSGKTTSICSGDHVWQNRKIRRIHGEFAVIRYIFVTLFIGQPTCVNQSGTDLFIRRLYENEKKKTFYRSNIRIFNLYAAKTSRNK